MSDNKKTGYKNPPLVTRFQPGQSGNPSGRKKLTGDQTPPLNLVIECFTRIRRVNTKSGPKRIHTIQLLAENLINKALQGDVKAMNMIPGLLKIAELLSKSTHSSEHPHYAAKVLRKLEEMRARKLESAAPQAVVNPNAPAS